MKYTYIILALLLTACGQQNSKDKQIEKTAEVQEEPLYDYDIEERLKELGIELSNPKMPEGMKITFAVQNGNTLYLSGNLPYDRATKKLYAGKLGKDLTVEEGYQAARLTAINQISVLKEELGDLNRVEKIIKVLGMVNATPDFKDHPQVMNGFTDVMVKVFGERGVHARSAVGLGSIPLNAACEVEMIVQIKE